MNLPAAIWIGLCLILMLIFTFWGTDNPRRALRSIPAFKQLHRMIELSVEDGSRLHISMGRSGILGPEAAAAFAGLTLLRQAADIAADSDQPPIATTGEGTVMLLAQDLLRNRYRRLGIPDSEQTTLVQTTGLTPFSYAAGVLPLILDRKVSSSAMAGSFGEEAGLITSAAQTSGSFSFGTSDSLTGQAIYFASAEQPLLGEELFATGAYMKAGPTHQASLRAQDILRWVAVALLIITAFLPLLGLG